jgi:lipid II:glycine glycyltransferase (peptidoglycan interpeptide bridge formation enzyme)
MDLFFTKEDKWLRLWNDFLKHNSRGHYSQYSTWLKSYSEYGFDFQLLLLVEDECIIGGCGLVIPKVAFLKFVIVPVGPIINEFNDDKIELLLQEIHQFALHSKACYLQINLPYLASNLKSSYSISSLKENSFYTTGLDGNKFKYVISVDGYRFVDLSDKNPEKNYSSNTKRNIKKSLDGNLKFKFAKSAQEIEIAYQCIVTNAKTQGYSVRSYAAFRSTISQLIENEHAIFAVCILENKVVGSLFLIESGGRYNYISGGIERNFNNYKIGHFLHHTIIEMSMQKNYDVYDISIGGNSGVVRFKEGFGGKHLRFVGTKYWILKPSLFKIFLFFDTYLKPHKAKIARILSKIK